MVDLTPKQIRGKLNHMKGDGRRMGIQLLSCIRNRRNQMTEEDYIIVTNRVKVSSAMNSIRSCSVGDNCGMSKGQQLKLIEIMHTIETRLLKEIERISV